MKTEEKYIVVGLGKSGLSLCEYLCGHHHRVLAYDKKASTEVAFLLEQYPQQIEVISGEFPISQIHSGDIMVLSPGVPTNLDFIQYAKKHIPVIGEIELAYTHCRGDIIAITGTNGKTTTTTLTGEILKKEFPTHVVGNIGNVFIGEVDKIKEGDAVVAEISSYQLETIQTFRPKICAILNITPDHLARHGSFEAYIDAKKRCFENMESSYIVLNADNPITASMDCGSNKPIYFSTVKKLQKGAWIEDGCLMINTSGKTERLCSVDELLILGTHNIENALAAALLSSLYGASANAIAQTLKTFQGVAHRIEYCGQINNIKFYNDSKGTNCDSTIKAIEAMPSPTALILGGFDKGGSFDELFDVINNNKIVKITVLGQTAPKILETAKRYGFEAIELCSSLEEAIEKAYLACKPGENVLLSPACASWDMFRDFEERGDLFKKKVREIVGQAD